MILLIATLLASLLGVKVCEVGNQTSHLQTLVYIQGRGFYSQFPPKFYFYEEELLAKMVPRDLVTPQSKKFYSTWIQGGSFLVTKRLPDQDFYLHPLVYKDLLKGQPTCLFSLKESSFCQDGRFLETLANTAFDSFRLALGLPD